MCVSLVMCKGPCVCDKMIFEMKKRLSVHLNHRWVRFMSLTREAFNQFTFKTPLHHKPRSFFFRTSSILFLKSISLSGSGLKIGLLVRLGGRRPRAALPLNDGHLSAHARCDWPSQLDAVAMGFLSCCERSSRVRDSSRRS